MSVKKVQFSIRPLIVTKHHTYLFLSIADCPEFARWLSDIKVNFSIQSAIIIILT